MYPDIAPWAMMCPVGDGAKPPSIIECPSRNGVGPPGTKSPYPSCKTDWAPSYVHSEWDKIPGGITQVMGVHIA